MDWTLSPGYLAQDDYIMVVPAEERLHTLSIVEVEHISSIVLLLLVSGDKTGFICYLIRLTQCLLNI